MPQILKNKNLELVIDLPDEGYQGARFDRMGKITKVSFQGIAISGREKATEENSDQFGRGFYNEVGFKAPTGFKQASIGEWFHKIGVGLLKKEHRYYIFSRDYEVILPKYLIDRQIDRLTVSYHSEPVNGYSYFYKKEIRLLDNGFAMDYELVNTGSQLIHTNEYNHNFIAINNDPICEGIKIKFPFVIRTALMKKNINPGNRVLFSNDAMDIVNKVAEVVYFSRMSGTEKVPAEWTLLDSRNNISIRERGNFNTKLVCLWGCGHAISPEVFIDIKLPPGERKQWSRSITINKITPV